MSNASISSNDDAIAYINDEIKKYREAINKIKQNNENARIDTIIKNIEDNIGYLNELIKNLNSLNNKISSALKEKEEKSNSS